MILWSTVVRVLPRCNHNGTEGHYITTLVTDWLMPMFLVFWALGLDLQLVVVVRKTAVTV